MAQQGFVMRLFQLSGLSFTLLLMAACSSTPAPIHDRTQPVQPKQSEYKSVRPESGETRAANIKRLYPNKKLFVCRGMTVSNQPETNAQKEVIFYSRLVVVRGPGGDVPVVTAPANNACISSGFGIRTLKGQTRPHQGLDITSRPASRVFSGAAGRILEAGYNGGYGLSVLIDHGKGVYTRYAHLNHIEDDIKVGQNVVYGHPIGLMGRSGHVTGIHLHYEILTGRYKPGVWGRGLKAHDPFSFPPWIDDRLS